jgi:hypothetical protein
MNNLVFCAVHRITGVIGRLFAVLMNGSKLTGLLYVSFIFIPGTFTATLQLNPIKKNK